MRMITRGHSYKILLHSPNGIDQHRGFGQLMMTWGVNVCCTSKGDLGYPWIIDLHALGAVIINPFTRTSLQRLPSHGLSHPVRNQPLENLSLGSSCNDAVSSIRFLVRKRRTHTASSRSCISSEDRTAQAATMFSPCAERDAISFARDTIAGSIPLIAAQLCRASIDFE